MLHAEIYQGYDANERIVMDILTPNREDIILEIGVGTGVCAKRIAPMVSQYVGIDIASSTIEALEQHLKKHNIKFYCFDMCNDVLSSDGFVKSQISITE